MNQSDRLMHLCLFLPISSEFPLHSSPFSLTRFHVFVRCCAKKQNIWLLGGCSFTLSFLSSVLFVIPVFSVIFVLVMRSQLETHRGLNTAARKQKILNSAAFNSKMILFSKMQININDNNTENKIMHSLTQSVTLA